MTLSEVSTEMQGKERQGPRTRIEPRGVLYGLPCANCRAYYPAILEACPVCSSVERVSPYTTPFTLAVSSGE
jgi:uncharacterized OB-fold protein